ncbi:unnamed protein product [Allacma fusca]|uniref:Uncharacterized protein n=1 Tax=Allacma fusca TaxID=39272 RepID=A0A8J2Q626_9HEXA|nr:unnamed protein product [Allacma fusca]
MGSKIWSTITLIGFTLTVMQVLNSTNGQEPKKIEGTPKMIFSRALASAICEQQKLFVEKEAVQEPLKERAKWRYAILPSPDKKCYDVRWNVCPKGTPQAPIICNPFQAKDCKN